MAMEWSIKKFFFMGWTLFDAIKKMFLEDFLFEIENKAA
jgi:hypothetical protein